METNQKILAQKIIRLHQDLCNALEAIANSINIEDKFLETHESHKIAFLHLAEVANIPICPMIYYESMRHFALNYACESTDSLNLKHQSRVNLVESWLNEIRTVANS